MNFGENLKQIRKQRKMSQETLAEKVGVSRQSVSKWEVGDAYPEMNNILELCKIFNCHINDLVHENMSDINSLDKEIIMSVVKFKKEQQRKMKGISKVISIFSKIGKVINLLLIGIVFVLMFFVPTVVGKTELKNGNLLIDGNKVEITEGYNTLEKVQHVMTNHSNVELIIFIEIIIICLIICLGISYLIFKNSDELFSNLHDGQTPFTLVNIEYINRISKLLIAYVVIPTFMGFVMQFVIGVDLEVEFEIMDIILILVAISISYIFEYGYQIQLDSKGVMYDEK